MLAIARPTAEGFLSDSMWVTELVGQGAAVNADVGAASLQPGGHTGTPLKHMLVQAWTLCKPGPCAGLELVQAWTLCRPGP